MQILWWLAPPVAVTVLAMVWVAWLGREGRGEVDREVAVRRLGAALSKPAPRKVQAATRVRAERDRSTGLAVRPSQRSGRSPAEQGRRDGQSTRRAS